MCRTGRHCRCEIDESSHDVVNAIRIVLVALGKSKKIGMTILFLYNDYLSAFIFIAQESQ